jgi:hypothetical protein
MIKNPVELAVAVAGLLFAAYTGWQIPTAFARNVPLLWVGVGLFGGAGVVFLYLSLVWELFAAIVLFVAAIVCAIVGWNGVAGFGGGLLILAAAALAFACLLLYLAITKSE